MFSFSGLASGLNTGTMIQQLVALERLPIQRFQAQKADEKSKLDLVGTLRKHVRSLQDAAGEIRTLAKFRSFQAQASQEGVAAFDVGGGASAGSHSLRVQSLAQVDRWTFDGIADDTQSLASGAGQGLSFSVGGTLYEIEIDPEESTLQQVAAAVQAQAGEAVAASVVNTGTASAPSYQLVLTSKTSGVDGRISGITSSLDGLAIDATPPDDAGAPQSVNNITVGSNAVVVLNGLTVERSTNKIDGVLAGVTIDLLSLGDGQELTFTISPDKDAIKGRIQKFVDAYNQVMGFIGTQNTFNPDSGPGGKLFGDSLLASVRREVRGALFDNDLSAMSGGEAGFATLNMVGIKLEKDGKLSIDQTVLDEKIATDLDALADLFVDTDGFDNGGAEPNTPGYYEDLSADTGLAERLHRAIARMFQTIPGPEGTTLKGMFDTRADRLNASMKRFDKQIEQRERYIEQFQAGLVKRFAALEQLIGTLNSQGAALNSMLLSLQPRN